MVTPRRGAVSGRRRIPAWARVLAWAVGTVVVLVAGAVVWLIAMFAGGLDDLFGDPRSPDDPAVVEAYERTRPINSSALDRTVSGLDGALGPVEPLGAAHGERCRQGQHNWKIDDSFDLWCSVTDSRLVAVNTLPTFRADMLALDEHLTSQGWAGDSFDIPYVLGSYWDHREEIATANPEWSYPHEMPSASYARGEEQLTIDWAVHGRAGGPYEATEQWIDVSGDRAALEALAGRIPEGGYGLTVTMTRDYFYE